MCIWSYSHGIWPSVRSRWLDIGQVLFWCVYFASVHKLTKKITRPIFSHLDLTNLVNKWFIIWLLGKFFLRDTVGSPELARWLHLACSVSQSHCAIWFILPTHYHYYYYCYYYYYVDNLTSRGSTKNKNSVKYKHQIKFIQDKITPWRSVQIAATDDEISRDWRKKQCN